MQNVNPFIGASTSLEYGEGKTFPGAATPFGAFWVNRQIIGQIKQR